MGIMIKNIKHEEVLPLAQQVQVMPGQVVSRTLAQNGAVSITLFAFDKGEEISTHESSGDAMVIILEGTALITIAGQKYKVNAGETIVMPAQKPHSLYAEECFKMMLTVVFPQK